jgi:hypothetical protein
MLDLVVHLFLSAMYQSFDGEAYGLGCGLGEEVSGQKISCNTRIESCIAVVGGIYNGILETAWVLQVQVDLASFGLVCLGSRGTNVCLERIKTKCYNLGS